MAAVRPLETLIADYRSDARALERTNNLHDAELIQRFCNEVEQSAEDYLKFLTETEAVLHSGHSRDWLRVRFQGWARLGHAKRREHGKPERLYRRCILPRRADVAAARADARRAARGEAQ